MVRIAYIGWNTRSGLGYLGADIVRHLKIDRWVAPRHGWFPYREPPEQDGLDYYEVPRGDSKNIDRTLDGIDWIVTCEHIVSMDKLFHVAAQRNIRHLHIPMYEYAHWDQRWFKWVDIMLVPCHVGFEYLHQIRHGLGTKKRFRGKFRYDLHEIKWPIDTDKFPFKLREKCTSFLYVDGTGGLNDRKGSNVVLEAARLVPEIPILFRTQRRDGMFAHNAGVLPDDIPPNVHVMRQTHDNAELYGHGSIAIQPSRYEGLGLTLLECQAAGLPLITTDAPPMSEHSPLDVIRCRKYHPKLHRRTITAWNPDPSDLADKMQSWWGRDISEHSQSARAYIEREHSWESAKSRILELMGP